MKHLIFLLLIGCSTASTPERSIEELFEHYRIASSPGALSIPQESISDEDLAAILGDPRTPELRSLELSGNQLTSTGLGHILSSPKTQALTFLNLAHNHLDDESIQALASSSRMTSIEHLLLAGNRIGPIGTTYLTKSPHLQNLRVLSLGNQGIEDGGAIALAELDSLETLDLSQAQITASGASKLLEKSKAETLILSGNPLNRGTLNLERFSGELTELELRDCSIGAEELDALQSVDHGGSIRTINLNNNPLGDAGTAALGRAGWLSALKSMEAYESGASLESLKALRESWGKRGGLKVETR